MSQPGEIEVYAKQPLIVEIVEGDIETTDDEAPVIPDWRIRELSPTDIERGLTELARRLWVAAKTIDEAETTSREKAREYDRAFARSFLSAGGPQYTRRYTAELATIDERDAMDIADLALKHADREAKRLDKAISTLQSLLKGSIAAYGAETRFGQ